MLWIIKDFRGFNMKKLLQDVMETKLQTDSSCDFMSMKETFYFFNLNFILSVYDEKSGIPL